jgi:homoserine O-succinyltransferase/O-acetyltransferase
MMTTATSLDIGLVNNMPDAAFDATERQFRALLNEAADGLGVRLRLLALQEVPRTEPGRRHLERYGSIATLSDEHLDGLIVTGTDPRTRDLQDEPYWDSLAHLVDWADGHTSSTIWSCLAAHAAVLHLDGIDRRRLATKRFGLFECASDADHPLTASAPTRLRIPHSRWHDLPEDGLRAHGYRILLRSDDAGPDMFVKHHHSLFVFVQGHPEYEAETLLLEYRRDIRRFLEGEVGDYPPMPRGCFDAGTVEAFTAFQGLALSDRREARLAEFPTALAARGVTNIWRPAAASIYRSWLLYLCAARRPVVQNSV